MTEQLGRRDFLKLAGLGALTLVAPRISQPRPMFGDHGTTLDSKDLIDQNERLKSTSRQIFSSSYGTTGYALLLDTTGSSIGVTLYVGQPNPDGKGGTNLFNSIKLTSDLVPTAIMADNDNEPVVIRGEGKNIIYHLQQIGVTYVPELAVLENDQTDPVIQRKVIEAGNKIIDATGTIETFGVASITIIKEGKKIDSVIVKIDHEPNKMLGQKKVDISPNPVVLYPVESTEEHIDITDTAIGDTRINGIPRARVYRNRVENETVFTPAETIEFSENLSKHELELAKDADLKAIYWDIVVSHLGDTFSTSKGMELNREIYEQIINDHPEWKGISHSSEPTVKLAYMQEFLTRSGGKMIIQNHVYEKFEVNLNKPVAFKVTEVDQLSPTTVNFLGLSGDNPRGRGGGGLVTVDENNLLTYKIEILESSLDSALSDSRYIYNAWGWNAGGIISDLVRQTIATTAYKDKDSVQFNYNLYTRGGIPKTSGFYKNVSWTFIR